MRMQFILLKLTILIIIYNITTCKIAFAQNGDNLVAELMKNTYKIETDSSCGTVFVLHDFKSKRLCMFTAAHVLEGIKGDSATLITRFLKTDGYRRLPYRIQIRRNGKELWKKHPELDIAAMLIALPETTVQYGFSGISSEFFADEQILSEIDLNPGDEVYIIGYPKCFVCNEEGFPILRTGSIASYPILPINKYKTFWIDFEILGGNSGSPVFIVKRDNWGERRYIIGIIYKEGVWDINNKEDSRLSVGKAVHAVYVKELLNMTLTNDANY